jgi:hypothetical protein
VSDVSGVEVERVAVMRTQHRDASLRPAFGLRDDECGQCRAVGATKVSSTASLGIRDADMLSTRLPKLARFRFANLNERELVEAVKRLAAARV